MLTCLDVISSLVNGIARGKWCFCTKEKYQSNRNDQNTIHALMLYRIIVVYTDLACGDAVIGLWLTIAGPRINQINVYLFHIYSSDKLSCCLLYSAAYTIFYGHASHYQNRFLANVLSNRCFFLTNILSIDTIAVVICIVWSFGLKIQLVGAVARIQSHSRIVCVKRMRKAN